MSRWLSPERRRWLKRFGVARLAAAVRRRRRSPFHAVRSELAFRRDGRPGTAGARLTSTSGGRLEVPAVVCFVVGPGQRRWLEDSLESVAASQPGAAVIIADDAALDSRAGVLRERWPDLDYVRMRWPTGGPPLGWRPPARAIAHALEHYEFPVFLKLDTDAVVCGPRVGERVAAALGAAGVSSGMGGSVGRRADGEPEEVAYHAEIIAREARRDRRLAWGVQELRRRGAPLGVTVQGGAFALTREACMRLRDSGVLGWRQSWRSLIGEDTAFSLFVRALGLELVCLSQPPHELFAVGNKHLPLELEDLDRGDWVLAHSTRRGRGGEDEAQVRAFLRERRTRWALDGA